MKIKTLFILLVFSILSLSSCKYFKKCEGYEDVYVQMDPSINALFHFQSGERMVFTDGNGVYDTAYWDEAVRYYDKADRSSYKCIGRKGDCCAKQYPQMASQSIYFVSGDKNKPTKLQYDSHSIYFSSLLPLVLTKTIKCVYKGILYEDCSVNSWETEQGDTTLLHSVSKGILFMKITNDNKSKTRWERVF